MPGIPSFKLVFAIPPLEINELEKSPRPIKIESEVTARQEISVPASRANFLFPSAFGLEVSFE